MRDHRGGVRRGTLTRLVPLALIVTVLTAGCTESDDKAEVEPIPRDTPVADIDLSDVTASRTSFCDALNLESVATALGGEPARTDAYASGQRALLAPGLRDVAHEFSCTFERGPRMARAWLFAQPATPADARAWVKERAADEACRPAGELSFGDPGLVQLCHDPSQLRVTAVGLFGDGYLTCKLTGPLDTDEADLLDRAQRWCAEVAQTTAT